MTDHITSYVKNANGSWTFNIQASHPPKFTTRFQITIPAGIADADKAREALIILAKAQKAAWISSLKASREFSRIELNT